MFINGIYNVHTFSFFTCVHMLPHIRLFYTHYSYFLQISKSEKVRCENNQENLKLNSQTEKYKMECKIYIFFD